MASVTEKSEQTELSVSDFPTRPSRMHRLALGLSVGFCGIAIALVLFFWLQAREQQYQKARFQLDARDRTEAVERAVADRLSTVHALGAFFAGALSVERSEFRTFSLPLLEGYGGVRALAWVPRIPDAQREAHQQAVRRNGFPGYTIAELNPKGDLIAAGDRDEYYPILFIEPSEEYRSSLGLDLATFAAYRAAFSEAIKTGQPTIAISPPLDAGSRDGNRLIVIEPVWGELQGTIKRPSDQPEIDGFVLGIFRVATIAKDALEIFHPLGIDLYMYDSSEVNGKTLVAARLSSLHGRDADLEPLPSQISPPKTDVHRERTFPVANHRWTLDCVPMDVFFIRQGTRGPLGALLAGLAVTALLVGYIELLAGRTARVERLVAERTRELRESEQRFRRLVDNASDAFVLRDMQGRIWDVNKWTCENLGYSREELLSMSVADIDASFASEDAAQVAAYNAEKGPISFERVNRRKDGTTFPVEVRSTLVEVGGAPMLVSLARDISQRKHDEEALRHEQRALRDTLDLHERDRKLIAFEIHDGLAQQLTGALYKFQSIEQMRARDPVAAGKLFDEAVRLLRESLAECRRLISGLRPPVLDAAGIVAAIESLVAERSGHGGPQIEFVHDVAFERLAPSLETAAFRIVQECLTNACRHGKSPRVQVSLRQVEDHMRLDVQDWGIGFEPNRILRGHFGLEGIRERARLLAGTVAIQSAPGQGAHVIVELPLTLPVEIEPADDEDQSADRPS
jgi:PAS domain S-box-containing protein